MSIYPELEELKKLQELSKELNVIIITSFNSFPLEPDLGNNVLTFNQARRILKQKQLKNNLNKIKNL